PDRKQQIRRARPRRFRVRVRFQPAVDLPRSDRRVSLARDEDRVVSVIAAATRRTALPTAAARGIRPGRVALHGFLIAMTAVWLFPLFWAIYSSLRPISDTIQHGFLSWPSVGLSLANYMLVQMQTGLPYYLLYTLLIV